MSGSEEGDGQFTTAITLLRQATDILSSVSCPQSSSSASSSTSSTSNRVIPRPDEGSSTSAVLNNFRNLFSPYGSVPSTSSRNLKSTSSRNSARSGKRFVPYKVKETWTHEFFCLSHPEQETVPSKAEKIHLQETGLGRKKIVFASKDGPCEVKSKLESTYPKLVDGGGFEILRSGAKSELVLITPPAVGYSVPFLRDQSGLAQALAYIRPLQSALPVEMDSTAPMDDVCDNKAPKVNCIKCGEEIIITQVRLHQSNCKSLHEHNPVGASNTAHGSNHLLQLASSSCQSTKDGDSFTELNALFPEETEETIRGVLMESGGDTVLAASRLVQWDTTHGTSSDIDNTGNDFDDDIDLLQSPFSVEGGDIDPVSKYRKQILKSDEPPLRVYINRMQEEFASDVLTIYKKANPSFCSSVRVKFENERGVGDGPVREFFSLLMGMVQNGFPLEESQLTLVFEGQADHKVPVPNALLCSSGFFTSAGRMMAHSFLHGGPALYGISPSVIEYWCSDSIDSITIEDVPDFELRQALVELTSLDKDEEGTNDLLEFLRPYRDEAAVLQVPLSGDKRHIALQRILVYNVIEKRRNELRDLVKGMNELSLVNYLRANKEMVKVVFPREAETVVDPDELKERIMLENPDHPQAETLNGLLSQFISDISHQAEGGASVKDLLAFWTGWEIIPPKGQTLRVYVDDEKSPSSLPESKSWFNRLMLSSQQTEYSAFKASFITALKYGSRGYTSL